MVLTNIRKTFYRNFVILVFSFHLCSFAQIDTETTQPVDTSITQYPTSVGGTLQVEYAPDRPDSRFHHWPAKNRQTNGTSVNTTTNTNTNSSVSTGTNTNTQITPTLTDEEAVRHIAREMNWPLSSGADMRRPFTANSIAENDPRLLPLPAECRDISLSGVSPERQFERRQQNLFNLCHGLIPFHTLHQSQSHMAASDNMITALSANVYEFIIADTIQRFRAFQELQFNARELQRRMTILQGRVNSNHQINQSPTPTRIPRSLNSNVINTNATGNNTDNRYETMAALRAEMDRTQLALQDTESNLLQHLRNRLYPTTPPGTGAPSLTPDFILSDEQLKSFISRGSLPVCSNGRCREIDLLRHPDNYSNWYQPPYLRAQVGIFGTADAIEAVRLHAQLSNGDPGAAERNALAMTTDEDRRAFAWMPLCGPYLTTPSAFFDRLSLNTVGNTGNSANNLMRQQLFSAINEARNDVTNRPCFRNFSTLVASRLNTTAINRIANHFWESEGSQLCRTEWDIYQKHRFIRYLAAVFLGQNRLMVEELDGCSNATFNTGNPSQFRAIDELLNQLPMNRCRHALDRVIPQPLLNRSNPFHRHQLTSLTMQSLPQDNLVRHQNDTAYIYRGGVEFRISPTVSCNSLGSCWFSIESNENGSTPISAIENAQANLAARCRIAIARRNQGTTTGTVAPTAATQTTTPVRRSNTRMRRPSPQNSTPTQAAH